MIIFGYAALAPSAAQQTVIAPEAAPPEPRGRGFVSTGSGGGGVTSTPTCTATQQYDSVSNTCIEVDATGTPVAATATAITAAACTAEQYVDGTGKCVALAVPIYKKPIFWAGVGGVAVVGGWFLLRGRPATKAVAGRRRKRTRH